MTNDPSLAVFGIRHHGPGSARCLVAALADYAPDIVLIEGPPDAAEVLPLAGHEAMRPPVALREHELASRALELMTSIGVRELPVVDDDQHVLGVIDEAAIAHEYVRVRAAGRADAAASGVRALGPDASA